MFAVYFKQREIHTRYTCGICTWYSDCRGTNGTNRHIFFCDECGLEKAKIVSNMGGGDLHRLQVDAMADATPRIGAYIDGRIKKTDLAEFTGKEFSDLIECVIREYRKSMQTMTEAYY